MNIRTLLEESVTLAKNTNSAHVLPEHIIYEMLKYSEITTQLKKFGIRSTSAVKKDLELFIRTAPIKKTLSNDLPELSYDVEYIFRQALTQSLISGKRTASNLDVLLSVIRMDCSAFKILKRAGLNDTDMLEHFYKGSRNVHKETEEEKVFSPSKKLDKFTKHYNHLALSGKFMPCIGREKEIENICHTLLRKTKNSILLVGDPGVGKSAIVEGLAQKIVQKKNIPEELFNAQIYSLDINSLIAGANQHGSFEDRIKGIIEELEKIPNAILYIDEIQNIIGTGGGSNFDIAAVVKNAMSSDNLKVIGTVSTEDFRKYIDKDRNLLRRFNKIDIEEASKEETLTILHGIKPVLEKFYNCTVSDVALEAAVDLSSKYLFDKAFPDKAIDLLDSSLATAKMTGKNPNYVILKNDILREVSKFTKISESEINESEKSKLINLKSRLESKIFGQSGAVERLVDAIYISKTGLRSENKTVANILFRGPTATGKTELAKELAKSLGIDLVRFDLSAYQEKFSLSMLIGSPPGYLGYSDGRAGDGLLVNAVEKSPNGIILLDEVEKAHPDVLNILLQIMDYGILTSSSGKVVNCRNNIIIMTSNIGAEAEERQRIGFGSIDNSDKFEEAFKSFFRPEFRSRLDAVIKFNKLGSIELERIVLKIFDETASLLHKQGISLVMTDNTLKYLAKKAEFANCGARIVNNLIDAEIKPKLASLMIFAEENSKLTFTVECIDDSIQIL